MKVVVDEWVVFIVVSFFSSFNIVVFLSLLSAKKGVWKGCEEQVGGDGGSGLSEEWRGEGVQFTGQ